MPDPFTVATLVGPSVRRLGERTCVINVGTDLRHVELPVVDEAVRTVMHDECRDLVFDLTFLRRYETFALVRLAREWDRLAAARLHDPRRRARGARGRRPRAAGRDSQAWELHSLHHARAARAALRARRLSAN